MPRKCKFPDRSDLLPQAPRVSKQTQSIGERCLAAFISWLNVRGVLSDLDRLSAAPGLLDRTLREYGRDLWTSKQPLYRLRHTIAILQRLHPPLRHALPFAWQTVSIWEDEEPLDHRVPLPTPVYRAMIATAIYAGFLSWAGVLMVAFQGLGRIGEPLRALRSALLLPLDLASPDTDRAFLNVVSPKTATRGGGRTQHLLLTGQLEVSFLQLLFGPRPAGAKLFPFPDRIFREVWDWTLSALEIPSSAGLTPGGVRGGAAIAAYRAGSAIEDIRWRMRLRSQDTLRSYLQEANSLSCFGTLPGTAQQHVLAAGKFYVSAISGQAPSGSPPGLAACRLVSPVEGPPPHPPAFVVDGGPAAQ